MNNIDFSAFHDSQLSKIELRDGIAELTFKLVNESLAVVSLIGLDRLVCNSLKEGNIVLGIDVVVEPHNWNYFLSKIFELNEEEKKNHPDYLVEIKNKLNDRSLVLFHLSPSYGAELVVLCKAIRLSIL